MERWVQFWRCCCKCLQHSEEALWAPHWFPVGFVEITEWEREEDLGQLPKDVLFLCQDAQNPFCEEIIVVQGKNSALVRSHLQCWV